MMLLQNMKLRLDAVKYQAVKYAGIALTHPNPNHVGCAFPGEKTSAGKHSVGLPGHTCVGVGKRNMEIANLC